MRTSKLTIKLEPDLAALNINDPMRHMFHAFADYFYLFSITPKNSKTRYACIMIVWNGHLDLRYAAWDSKTGNWMTEYKPTYTLTIRKMMKCIDKVRLYEDCLKDNPLALYIRKNKELMKLLGRKKWGKKSIGSSLSSVVTVTHINSECTSAMGNNQKSHSF